MAYSKDYKTGYYTEKEVRDAQKGAVSIEAQGNIDGFPLFNTCDHHTVDLSHLEKGKDNYQSTISVKLPHGQTVTFNVMDLGRCVNIDVHLQGHNDMRVLGFNKDNTGQKSIEDVDLIALVSGVK